MSDARNFAEFLTLPERRFLLQFGELGTRFGVSRTVTQVLGVLLLSGNALSVEELAGALGVVRSHIAGAVKELEMMGMVRRLRNPGERTSKYDCEREVGELVRMFYFDRQRRDIEPMIRMLQGCIEEGNADGLTHPKAVMMFQEMESFLVPMKAYMDELFNVRSDLLKLFFEKTAKGEAIDPPESGGRKRKRRRR